MRRILSVGLCLLALGGPALGQSLAELAKKEKERRKKVEGEAKVIDDEALAEAGSKAGSETSTTVTTAKSGSLAGRLASARATAVTTAEAREWEKKRAIERLESMLVAMKAPATRLVLAAQRYQANCTGGSVGDRCQDDMAEIVREAIAVGRMLEQAQELARTSGVTPGELRELREKHGFDHHVWDAAVRFAAKYGRR